MRRFLASVAFALLAAASAGGSVPVLAQQDPASRALRFLAGQQAADGHVDGFDPAQGTEDYLLAAASSGYDPNSLHNLTSGHSGYDYLAANVASATTTAGRSGRLLMAVEAGGRSSTFAGVDLVSRLERVFYSGQTGRYGDSDSFSQALAILGLKSAGRVVPALAVAYLKSLQNADGSWYSGPAPGAGSAAVPGDTNSTALAVMALDAIGDHGRDASALAYLHTEQQPDGGFPYQSPSQYGVSSDPDSTGLVIQALIASGQTPSFSAWTEAGAKTPYTWMVSNQDPASGGYLGYLGTPDPATTVQATGGLTLSTLPPTAVHGPGFGLCAAATAGVRAIRFLAAAQAADGHVDGFTPAQGTEDYVLAAVAAGYDPATLRAGSGASAYDFLAANLTAATSTAGASGRLLEAVRAGGRSPVFGGMDLVDRLQTHFYSATSGRYGDSDAFGQALAILGLRSAGRTVPAAAVAFLKSLQNADGSWYFGAPPGAGQPANQGDTNNTAMALMALAAVGDHSSDATSLAWLRGQQGTDGGFPYQATYPPSDPDSTGLVLQALLATGQNPAAWVLGGASPITFLVRSQDDPSGGYLGYLGTPDAATTAPLPVALERLPYPILQPFVSGAGVSTAGPTNGVCPSATPAPSPSPSPSPSPAPPAAPSPVATAQPSPSPFAPSQPTPVALVSPSPSLTPVSASPNAAPAVTPSPIVQPSQPGSQPGPTVQPAPVPAGGGLPPLLVYGLAALGGLVVVGGAGAAYLLLVRNRQ